MTTQKIVTGKSYSLAMDREAHESTYKGFVKFVEISSIVVICWVLSLAIGGLKEAWTLAVLGVILSAIAGTVGALNSSIGVRAPAIVAIGLALLLLFY